MTNNNMSRRAFIGRSAAAAAVAGMGAQPSHAASVRSRPNILLLMTDQQRGDCLGCDGNDVISTPNIDRIAAEGAHFRCAYSSTPTCTPARSGLLTGLSPWHHGMLGYGRGASSYPVELPRAMRDAGYQTLGIGKMHWYPQRNLHGFHRTILDESSRSETPGFLSDYRAWFAQNAPSGMEYNVTGIGWNDYRSKSYVPDEELHPTRWTADRAIEFIGDYAGEEPFFLKVSFARPHSPYDPPQRFMDAYREDNMPKRHIGDWCRRFAQGNPSNYTSWQGDFGEEQACRSRRGYYGSISFIDEQVGRILSTLDKRGMLDDTLIIFTADHGDMTGDHHLWRKSYPYESSARIPFIVRPPKGFSPVRGATFRHPVELRDILPTCLDSAGVTMPGNLDGRSVLDIFRNEKAPWRDSIDLEHDVCYSPENHWNALTDGRYKYIYYAPTGEEQLFDLVDDPGEEHDLARENGKKPLVRDWRGRMIGQLAERGEPFVVNGDLGIRKERMLYSPFYPDHEARRLEGLMNRRNRD